MSPVDPLREIREAAQAARAEYDGMKSQLEMLSLVIDIAPIPMWIKRYEDGVTRMLRINRAYELRWGIKKEEYEGKTDVEKWGEEIGGNFLRNDIQAIRKAPHPIIAMEPVPDLLSPGEEVPVWLVCKRAGSTTTETYVAGMAFREDEADHLMRELQKDAR